MLEEEKKEETETSEKAKVGHRSEIKKKTKRRSGKWQKSMRQKREKHEGI